jgi:IPT/TIG domain
MGVGWRASICLAAAGLALTVPTAAQALTVVGQLAPPRQRPRCTGNGDFFQNTLAEGRSYVVEHKGVITSWSTMATDGDGQKLTFKLLRPTPIGPMVVAHDGPRALVPGMVNTFRTEIPAEPGDILALNSANAEEVPNACSWVTGRVADSYAAAPGDVADGVALPSLVITGQLRVNVAATLLEPPSVELIGPAKSTLAGGTEVLLSGFNFDNVKSVTFGGVPARAFRVGSEEQILAISPARSQPGEVPVVVKTAAGAATAPEAFEYVRLPPRIVSVFPTYGSVLGGTAVTISGLDFSRVLGVSFGGAPAASFSVGSEERITAVAPGHGVPAYVPLEVTTPTGTAVAPQPFFYESCQVPTLKGKTLRAASKLLFAAECELGAVKRRHGAAGKVTKVLTQSITPGRFLAPETVVNVTVG